MSTPDGVSVREWQCATDRRCSVGARARLAQCRRATWQYCQAVSAIVPGRAAGTGPLTRAPTLCRSLANRPSAAHSRNGPLPSLLNLVRLAVDEVVRRDEVELLPRALHVVERRLAERRVAGRDADARHDRRIELCADERESLVV